ncbi:hypothetical protein Bcer98_0392 [Bacillus cytotoxicus NVH 391-98]|uniref:Uncharacterized protein n=1 Tax=Bacillus cytotoxicus (strain DSM 22905 / CIP 110041 / 391-98 / NVH 391-98) TaxID=315749 RepID=A7GKU0_BACCN|nr:hypothetical protein Bcer98_0392 [Bacillus cytotoxicus NVH 391-98]
MKLFNPIKLVGISFIINHWLFILYVYKKATRREEQM